MSPELQRELLLEAQRINRADIRRKIIGAVVGFLLLMAGLYIMVEGW